MPENTTIITNEATGVNPSNNVTGHVSYEKTRKELREFIQKRREIERALAAQEEIIIKKEQEYLEETPVGNIITGFDNYTRGGLVSGRRRGREEEDKEQRLRVFSRSSISWNTNTQEQPDLDHKSPNSKAANTAPSASSQKAEGTNNVSSIATGSTSKGVTTKKNKKGVEDSESDGRDQKKARVNFGVVRR